MFDQRCEAQNEPEDQATFKIAGHVTPGKLDGLHFVEDGRFFTKDLRVKSPCGFEMLKVKVIGGTDQDEVKGTPVLDCFHIIEDMSSGDSEFVRELLEELRRWIRYKANLNTIDTLGDVPDNCLHPLAASNDPKPHVLFLFSLPIFFRSIFRFTAVKWSR